MTLLATVVADLPASGDDTRRGPPRLACSPTACARWMPRSSKSPCCTCPAKSARAGSASARRRCVACAGEAARAARACRSSKSIALLDELAAIRGSGSSARRAAALRALFGRATREEQEFLLRLLGGRAAPGCARRRDDRRDRGRDRRAAGGSAARRHVRKQSRRHRARRASKPAPPGLQRFQLQVMSPVAPMLAQTANDVDEALETLSGDVAFEWKMDGARIQVHKQGDAGAHLHARTQRRDGGDSGDRRRGARAARRRSWCSMARRLRSRRRAGRMPSRPRCDASAASWTWRGCSRSCRCARSTSIACGATTAAWPSDPARERFAALSRSCARGAIDPATGHALPKTRRPLSMTRRWRRDMKA